MNRKHRHVRALAGLAVIGLVVASCGSDSDSSDDSAAPAATEAAVDETTAPADTEPADTASADTEPTDTDAADPAPADTEPTDPDAADGGEGFTSLAPPEGEPIILGMVNTEGSPGLDFPEISEATRAGADFLNEHGGMGGRPIQLEVCTADGAPETSQACAQELVGKGVEMVMLGLDLFPGYDTYTASDIPVTGVLPILPGDYTADALFLGGGNTTTTAAMAGFAVEELGAATAGIISADNAGANGTEADLKKALDAAGITYVSIKGGDNETDAGFQGLMSQATADDPDVLFSLYADAGCIGTMRGRVSLGIETPVITTAICSSAEVIDVVGDDATGWYFIGAQTERTGTPEADDYQTILDTLGYTNSTELGLGNLGLTGLLTLATIANGMADEGADVTGASIYETLGASDGVVNWPDGNALACGSVASIPTICAFTFPVATYVPGEGIQTVPGFEAFDTTPFLP
ncbi:MAG: ABC transporter substrate-binding protein [Ilumatobacteraceae bacterium]